MVASERTRDSALTESIADGNQGRSRPSVALFGLLAAVFGPIGFGLGWLVADDGDVGSASDLPALVRAWADATIDQDADALADLYEDGGFIDGPLGVGMSGREEIRANIEEYWEFRYGRVVDMKMEVDYVLTGPGGALVIWEVETTDEVQNTSTSRDVIRYEYDWDEGNLLRQTSEIDRFSLD